MQLGSCEWVARWLWKRRRTGKGIFIYFLGWRLFCGVVGSNLQNRRGLLAIWPHVKLQRLSIPVFWFATTCGTTAPPTQPHRMPSHGLLYTLVSRENVVLAEYTSTTGNFPSVTRMVLTKISTQEDHKMSLAYDTQVFHYAVSGGITYLVMADAALRRRMPFAFLNDIKEQFQTNYGDRAQTANAFAMNEEFAPVLQRRMAHFNNDPNGDMLTKAQHQVQDLKQGAMKNINKVLERGEKIDLLVDKTDRMKNTANKFARTSRNLKNQMWWRNIQMWAMVVCCAALVVYIIGSLVCGGLTYESCRST